MRKRPDLILLAAVATISSFTVTACVTTLTTPTPLSKRGAAATEAGSATRSDPGPAPAPAAPTSKNWTRISENPSSVVPSGLPKEAPTDHLHGEWLQTQDGSTRWFVPKGGFGKRSEDELRNEAYSMRSTADESSQVSRERRLPARARSWGSLLRRHARKTAEDNEP